MYEQFSYLAVLICTLIFPLLISLYPNFSFKHYWLLVVKNAFWVGIPFIIWDIWFASIGVWGFSPEKHVGVGFLGLPLEEWLFFVIIPISSMYLYYGVKQKLKENKLLGFFLRLTLLGLIGYFLIFNYDKPYSLCVSIVSALVYLLVRGKKWWNTFATFIPFILVCFLLVNGALTSKYFGNSDAPTVWYNPNATSQIRISSIPMEDFLFAFSLLGLNIYLFEKYKTE